MSHSINYQRRGRQLVSTAHHYVVYSMAHLWASRYTGLQKNIFESCLRFLNWFRVTWPRWIQKGHPFFWIRSGFCANSIKKIIKKSEIWNWMPTQNFYFLTDFFQINVEKIDWLYIMIVPTLFVAWTCISWNSLKN